MSGCSGCFRTILSASVVAFVFFILGVCANGPISVWIQPHLAENPSWKPALGRIFPDTGGDPNVGKTAEMIQAVRNDVANLRRSLDARTNANIDFLIRDVAAVRQDLKGVLAGLSNQEGNALKEDLEVLNRNILNVRLHLDEISQKGPGTVGAGPPPANIPANTQPQPPAPRQ